MHTLFDVSDHQRGGHDEINFMYVMKNIVYILMKCSHYTNLLFYYYERDTESRYQIRDWTEYLYLIQYMFSTYLKVVKEEENFRKQKFLRLG